MVGFFFIADRCVFFKLIFILDDQSRYVFPTDLKKKTKLGDT